MRFFAAALLLSVSACGSGTAATVGAEPRYTGTGTVLEDGAHGPQFCASVMQSLPPQCGGPDIVGWDWTAVRHQSQGGVKWGEYTVVGTWDGARLTLAGPVTEPQRPDAQEPSSFASPCPEPAGGWKPVDPAKATDATLAAAMGLARKSPQYAGAWVDQSHLGDGPLQEEGSNDPKRLVLNLAFTGDLAGHEQRVREVWGGALCVSAARYTEAELLRVQGKAQEEIPGVQVTGVDTVANHVDVTVFVVTDDLRKDLDARYGPGAVELSGVLQPVGG